MNAMVIRTFGETLGSGINFLTKKAPLTVTVALAVLSLTPAYRIPAALAMRVTSLYVSGRLLASGAGALELIKIASIALGIIGICVGGSSGFFLLAGSLILDMGFQAQALSIYGEKSLVKSTLCFAASVTMLLTLGLSSLPINGTSQESITRVLYTVAFCVQAAAIGCLGIEQIANKQHSNESLLSKGFDALCYTALAATAWTSLKNLESHMQDHYVVTVDKTTALYNKKGNLFATLEPGKHDIYIPINKDERLFGEGIGRISRAGEVIVGSPFPIYPTIAEYGEIHRLENTE